MVAAPPACPAASTPQVGGLRSVLCLRVSRGSQEAEGSAPGRGSAHKRAAILAPLACLMIIPVF